MHLEHVGTYSGSSYQLSPLDIYTRILLHLQWCDRFRHIYRAGTRIRQCPSRSGFLCTPGGSDTRSPPTDLYRCPHCSRPLLYSHQCWFDIYLPDILEIRKFTFHFGELKKKSFFNSFSLQLVSTLLINSLFMHRNTLVCQFFSCKHNYFYDGITLLNRYSLSNREHTQNIHKHTNSIFTGNTRKNNHSVS